MFSNCSSEITNVNIMYSIKNLLFHLKIHESALKIYILALFYFIFKNFSFMHKKIILKKLKVDIACLQTTNQKLCTLIMRIFLYFKLK